MNYTDKTYILMLRTLQNYTGLSVGEVAEELNYTGAYLSMMIHGTRSLTEPFKKGLTALTDQHLGNGASAFILTVLWVVDKHLNTQEV